MAHFLSHLFFSTFLVLDPESILNRAQYKVQDDTTVTFSAK